MALDRTAARRDKNERPIIEALKAVGCSILQISVKGAQDLDVGFRGVTYHMEIKDEKGKLTPDQEEYHKNWQGGKIWIVRSVPEALNVIGAVSIVPLNENESML